VLGAAGGRLATILAKPPTRISATAPGGSDAPCPLANESVIMCRRGDCAPFPPGTVRMGKRVLAVTVTMIGGACTSMGRVEPGQFIPAHKPEVVSVWTKRDDVTVVSNPQVIGDTLSGLVMDAPWARSLNDVVKVEATRADPARTAILVAGAAASAVGVYLLSNSAHLGAGSIPCPPGLPSFQQTQQCGATP
jgi:hypothetical protein